MKSLLFGIVLILVIGIAGFVYRNAVEEGGAPKLTACTLDAKVCPDGSSVGRVGPSCEFAACPAGNVEDATNGISYVLPAGYSADENAYGADPSLIGAYVDASSSDSIIVRDYPLLGSTTDEAMLAHTMFTESGLTATSTKQFSSVIVNGKTFRTITLDRFEGTVTTAYYLVRVSDLLRFDVTDKGVTNWTDATLDVNKLSAHAAFLQMLGTLKVSKP